MTHVDDAAAFGRRLAALRHRAGLTQRALAFPGCSPGYVARIEAGERVPSLQLIRELARRLGVSEEYLAYGEEAVPPLEDELVQAEAALRLGDLDLAAEAFSRVADAAALDSERARALGGLGQVAYARGKPRRAIQLLEDARVLAPDLPAPILADALGRAYATVGEHEEAIALFRAELARAEGTDDPFESLRFSVLLANALTDNSEFEEATSLLARMLQRASGEHEPLTRARLHWSQSRLHALRGNAEAATLHARRALAAVELTDNMHHRALAYRLLAFAELEADEPQTALEHLRTGRALLNEGGSDALEEVKFDLDEARALIRVGELERGAALALGAAGRLQDGHPLDLGRSFAEAARAFDEAGDHDRALELYELAADILDRQPSRYLADVLARLGDLHERGGNTEAALAAFKRAARLQAQPELRHHSLE